MKDDTTPDAVEYTDTRRKPRRGLLLAALAVAALMLGYEYRDVIFRAENLSALLLLACIGMHFFMHRGHSGGSDR